MPVEFTSFNNVALPRWSSNHYGQIIRIVDQRSDESGFGVLFFFFRKGGREGFDRFSFLFRILDNSNSFVEGKIFSLSFSFRFSIDRTGCSSRYSETERFASHKQFRKSFSFMRFCNNWFTSILLGIMQVFYIIIYFQSCLAIFEKF